MPSPRDILIDSWYGPSFLVAIITALANVVLGLYAQPNETALYYAARPALAFVATFVFIRLIESTIKGAFFGTLFYEMLSTFYFLATLNYQSSLLSCCLTSFPDLANLPNSTLFSLWSFKVTESLGALVGLHFLIFFLVFAIVVAVVRHLR